MPVCSSSCCCSCRMREARGNLWTFQPADARVITTNGDVNSKGQAVMGRGVAAQAATKWPGLKSALGKLIRANGSIVQLLPIQDPVPLIAMPVKEHWYEAANLGLIEESATALSVLANNLGLEHVVLPRPGCGNGQLSWPVVRACIATTLDDRFTVVNNDRE